MFFHNFKYSLKTLLRDKMLIFWTFAFPLILGTFFNMAFADIEKSEQLDIIPLAIVNEGTSNNEILTTSLESLSDKENDDRLFDLDYVELDKAKKLLEDDEISGYILLDDDVTVVIKSNGINQTIIKQVVDEILQMEKYTTAYTENRVNEEIEKNNFQFDVDKIVSEAISIANREYAKINNISNKNLSYTMIEFYTLIAMTCLYGGLLGMVAIDKNLANMSNNGKRIQVGPTNKIITVLSSALASYIVELIGIALLFIYTILFLHINYGSNILLIIILTLVGCLAGLSIGIACGTLLKTNENIKNGFIISITMLGCFFSGMMGITMKYIIDKNIPIINKLNPASMITDGFYSLYYYDTYNRFYFNLFSLIIFSLVLLTISFISLRRQKYDSL